jgi:hypothetical protein
LESLEQAVGSVVEAVGAGIGAVLDPPATVDELRQLAEVQAAAELADGAAATDSGASVVEAVAEVAVDVGVQVGLEAVASAVGDLLGAVLDRSG